MAPCHKTRISCQVDLNVEDHVTVNFGISSWNLVVITELKSWHDVFISLAIASRQNVVDVLASMASASRTDLGSSIPYLMISQ
jgi:hypothetical protein